MDRIAEFVRERNEALLSMDEKKIRAYAQKYQVHLSDDPEVFWGSVHKARCTVEVFSEEVKAESRAWLIAHGFYPGIRP